MLLASSKILGCDFFSNYFLIYLRAWPFSAPNQTFSCTESFQLEQNFQIEDHIQKSPLLPVKLDAEAAL